MGNAPHTDEVAASYLVAVAGVLSRVRTTYSSRKNAPPAQPLVVSTLVVHVVLFNALFRKDTKTAASHVFFFRSVAGKKLARSSVGCLVGWLADYLVGWLVGWLVDFVVCLVKSVILG